MRTLVLLSLISLLFLFCQNLPDTNDQMQIDSGESLSKMYCSTCHLYPEPALLNKETWAKSVLPRMGNMMGIYKDEFERRNLITNENEKSIYPESSLIEESEWKAIEKFYQQKAPDKLNVSHLSIDLGLENFKILKPSYKLRPPSSTLVKFIDGGNIFVGDAHSSKIFQFDKDLKLLKAGNIIEGGVHIELVDGNYMILCMGSFSPNDESVGILLSLSKQEEKKAKIIADHLNRPVHAAYGDLNHDGLTDIVISEFGKWAGQLRILSNNGNGEYTSQIIHKQTGAVKTVLQDFDSDGNIDIMALFAQGNEGISIFYNNGDFNFSQREVLRFSPSHGSTSFDLVDLENDGDWDIVYTAGDNADFKPILKPYHGIYLYENDGKENFSIKTFLSMNGCNSAHLEDFDLDGDLDIAAISFFPDYESEANESFVYFENNGEDIFSASTFINNTEGRWIVMDAKDKDNDGDVDIILGSLAFEVIPDKGYTQKWKELGLPFIVLENTIR